MATMGNQVTQIDYARAGVVTEQMRSVAAKEGICAESVREAVAAGRIAIPANIHHAALDPEGVGSCLDGVPLRTKVNVNLGISGDLADEEEEWRKVDVALELGAEAIMDLSNSGKTRAFRRALIERSPAMVGTVPMYDAIGYLEKALIDITPDDFLEVIRAHAEDGVDFVTVHAGMNRRVIDSFKETGRLTNIVSRGGSLIFAWMEATGNENPFYEFYDDVLAILHEHDVTISLGDAMRPGSIYDASDAAQIAELIEIGKLTQRAWDAGVQVITSGSIPTDPVRQEYLLMAAVEALTNAVRHGEADRLKIVLTEENGYIRVCFFNNGKNPTLPVREGGGLGALRIRLEEAGGSMQILTTPEFCLSVLLPKKGGREVCYRYGS